MTLTINEHEGGRGGNPAKVSDIPNTRRPTQSDRNDFEVKEMIIGVGKGLLGDRR